MAPNATQTEAAAAPSGPRTRAAAAAAAASGKSAAADSTKAMKEERNGHVFHMTVPQPRADATDFDILHGNHGLEKNGRLADFIWTVSDEPHRERRKQMMAEMGPAINELRGHEWRTKYIVTAVMAAHMALGYYLREEALWGGSLKFWVLTYIFGASASQALFLAVHEISHNLAFKSMHANLFFGMFVNLPMLLPFSVAFKGYHMEHHKLQGTDGVDEDLPTELEARLLSSTAGKWFYMFNQTWFYALRPVLMRPQPVTRWHLLNLACQVAFIAVVSQKLGWGVIIYLLASAHLAGSLHPLASHFIAEHYTFVGEAETASYYGMLNYFTWNVGYHNEHHDFPNIAWSGLPKLRDVGAKFYDKVPFHKSWIGALWAFLSDPEINMYNRVRREEKGAATEAELKKEL